MVSSPANQILQFSLGSLLQEDLQNPSILSSKDVPLQSSHKSHPIPHLLKTLQGLPIALQIISKLFSLSLQALCWLVSASPFDLILYPSPSPVLQTSETSVCSLNRSSLGAFALAVPSAWSTLLSHLPLVDSFLLFRSQLEVMSTKTFPDHHPAPSDRALGYILTYSLCV